MFGNKLKELRTSKGLSQKELANVLNLSPNAIYNWEVNRSQPSLEALTKIANYFNVTTDYLLNFNQDDLDKIEKLRIILKEAGINDIEQAMQIIDLLKKEKDK